MKRRVYVETTIASYLTARPSRDLIVAAHQELTMDWWTTHRERFDLYISDLVLIESARGDGQAAGRRLVELQGITCFQWIKMRGTWRANFWNAT